MDGWRSAGSKVLGLLAPLVFLVIAYAFGAAAGDMRRESQIFEDWRVPDLRSHPLVGKVWSAENGALVPASVVLGALKRSKLALLGEIHDNSDHHRIQAFLLDALTEDGLRPGLVFEQLRSDRQAALDAAGVIESIDELKGIVGWQASGWKEFDYDPIFEKMLAKKLEIFAGDVPRDRMMRVAKEGRTALSEAERLRLFLDRPLGVKQDTAALDEIFEAHCNMMPREALAGMAFAQRYRDAHLADTLLTAARKAGAAILFAGNGHVRRDRGVPWYLRGRAPEIASTAVMLIEVEEGKVSPDEYVPRDPDGKPAADFLIYTPRAKRGDPCAQMRVKSSR